MVWRRQGRWLAGAAMTAGVLSSLAWCWSPVACGDYIRFLTDSANFVRSAGYEDHLHRSPCWHGAWSLYFGPGTASARLATIVAVFATLAVTARICRRRADFGAVDSIPQYAAVLVSSCLVNPHLFAYDLTVLIAPLVLICQLPAETGFSVAWRRNLVLGLFVVVGVAPDVAQATHIEITSLALALWLWSLQTYPLPAHTCLSASTSSGGEPC
jgi:hypothetical protein